MKQQLRSTIYGIEEYVPGKICGTCREFLPVDKFDKNQYKKSGPQTSRPDCQDCRRKTRPMIKVTDEIRAEWEHLKPAKDTWFHCPGCRRDVYVMYERSVVLDHCHQTGWVLGYICNVCNTGMGKANDDPIMLLRWVVWKLIGRFRYKRWLRQQKELDK